MSDEIEVSDAPMFVRVFTQSCGGFDLEVAEMNRIDAHVTDFNDSGRSPVKDTWIHVTGLGGERIQLLTSDIRGLMESTPDTRRRFIENQKRFDDEKARIKAELGVWDDDDE